MSPRSVSLPIPEADTNYYLTTFVVDDFFWIHSTFSPTETLIYYFQFIKKLSEGKETANRVMSLGTCFFLLAPSLSSLLFFFELKRRHTAVN